MTEANFSLKNAAQGFKAADLWLIVKYIVAAKRPGWRHTDLYRR